MAAQAQTADETPTPNEAPARSVNTLPGVRYKPDNPVATFTDKYGEERVIHAPKGGRALRVAKNSDTPVHRLNRAAAQLLGQRIRGRRLLLGLTMQEVGERAGLKNANQKNYINDLEKAYRHEGMRLGTLYALAQALECEPGDLMPTRDEVMAGAGVRAVVATKLEAA